MLKFKVLMALGVISIGAAAGAQEPAVPTPAEQTRAWSKCRACHSTDPGASRQEGPTLHAILGTKAGQAADFKNYSAAMKDSGVSWTEENMDKFLAKPHQFLPGNTMPFPGMPRPEERAAVIAYLKSRADNKK